MHSLNYAVMGNVVAAERAARPSVFAQPPQRPERPPGVPMRGRAAYAAGRFARAWTARWRAAPSHNGVVGRGCGAARYPHSPCGASQ